VMPFLVRIWMFLSPVAYSSEEFVQQLPESLSWTYALNPIAGAIDGFRWSLYGEGPPPWDATLVAFCATAILFLGGLLYFRRVDRTLVDML